MYQHPAGPNQRSKLGASAMAKRIVLIVAPNMKRTMPLGASALIFVPWLLVKLIAPTGDRYDETTSRQSGDETFPAG